MKTGLLSASQSGLRGERSQGLSSLMVRSPPLVLTPLCLLGYRYLVILLSWICSCPLLFSGETSSQKVENGLVSLEQHHPLVLE